jgi:hypothetical protein
VPIISGGGGGGGSGSLATARVTLTHAQILDLVTTPVQIVAAQGAGTVIVPAFSSWVCNASAGAYTNFNAFSAATPYASSVYLAMDALNNFNDASGPIRADRILGKAFKVYANIGPISGLLIGVNATAGDSAIEYGPDAISVAVGYDNVPLYVVGQNDGLGNFTGGNAANTLTVTVAYFLAS